MGIPRLALGISWFEATCLIYFGYMPSRPIIVVNVHVPHATTLIALQLSLLVNVVEVLTALAVPSDTINGIEVCLIPSLSFMGDHCMILNSPKSGLLLSHSLLYYTHSTYLNLSVARRVRTDWLTLSLQECE